MSWDSYITNLTASGHVEKAAIVGLDGAIWASNLGYAAFLTYQTPVPDANNPDVSNNQEYNEWQNFNHALNNKGQANHAAGLRFNNQKYYTVSFDDSGPVTNWYLKKEKGGAAVARTKTAIVVGTFVQPQTPGDCNKEVENIAKYLIDNGL